VESKKNSASRDAECKGEVTCSKREKVHCWHDTGEGKGAELAKKDIMQ